MKNLKKIIYTIVISSLILQSNVAIASRNKNEQVQMPIQIKPERLQQLYDIANDKIKSEDFPYTEQDVENLKEILKLIEMQDEYMGGEFVEIQRLYRTINAEMTPDNKFEDIYLTPNYTTTIMFVDKMGNPWDIDKFIVGSSENFTPEQQDKHIITFSPTVNISNSNLTVLFKGGKRPLSFNLNVNPSKVDFITEIKINDYGINSPKEVYTKYTNNPSGKRDLSYLSSYEEVSMSEMLSNNLPSGFEERMVYNKFGELEDGIRVFYRKEDSFLYVRTAYQTFSPEPVGVYNSADKKMKVHKIPFTSRIIISKGGLLEQLNIK